MPTTHIFCACVIIVTMRSTPNDTFCSTCGDLIDKTLDTPENRIPCLRCGATARTIYESMIISVIYRDGIGLKGKRPGQKKAFVEDLSEPSFSSSKQKHVHRQRLIDRDNDQYSEKVTDYETGEVLHECSEPLSSHKGHGSARKKQGQNGG